MKIILCDDEPDILRMLRPFVESFFARIQVRTHVESCSCLEELTGAPGPYDIAFLDIELPDGNGLQAARHLREKNRNVIIFIVTSHEHYLDDAMDLNVFRYITKPIDRERLTKNLCAAWNRYCSQSQVVCTGNHGEAVRVFTGDILYICIKGRGTELHTERGCLETAHNLSHWAQLLDGGLFAQPHYSYLVNLRHVINLKKRELTLRKADGETMILAVSQRMYPAFKKAFFAMMGENLC